MAKIRSLGNRELKQVFSLLERFSDEAFHYPVLDRFKALYLPFHAINQCLPLKFKFLPGIYVATDGDKVLGLVWLSRDGYRTDRWRIDQIIIDPHYYSGLDVGKQLLYFVINKYGGLGVETFLANVDPGYTEGLALLKECSFRHCTRAHTYQLANISDEIKNKAINIQGLREAKPSDARKLQELHSETLVPEVRISLRRSPKDLYPGGWTNLTRRVEFQKRWVVSQGSQDYLYASVAITTWDYKHFDISLLPSPAWEDGTDDLLAFALQQVSKASSNPCISVRAYEFQKHKMSVLTAFGFTHEATTEILVKDYWMPLKDKAIKTKSPIILFAEGRTSPA